MRPSLTSLPLALLVAMAGIMALAIGAATPLSAQQSPSRVQAAIEDKLYSGTLEAGEAAVRAILRDEPGNAEAQFALGGIRLARAVERLGQAMYRHGLQAPRAMFVPFFAVPVPVNPRPEPLTYAGLREILAQFVRDLDGAEADLARVGDAPVHLTVDLARISLDFDGDGQAGARERLPVVIQALAQGARRRGIKTSAGSDAFPVGFDTADAYWMRGYANLMAAAAEFFLAYDFRTTFDSTFHIFFPRAGLPFSKLVTEPTGPRQAGDLGSIFDIVAFVHLVHWNVAEPQRLASVHARFKAVIGLSRKTWAAVLAETDDDNEWLPGPNQKGVLDMPVTADMVTAWLAMLDQLEQVLDGRLLAPHPRFVRGINVRKVFLEPKPFDLVLWITGHGVLPYLDDGPVLNAATWGQAGQVFRGNFLSYAFWFN